MRPHGAIVTFDPDDQSLRAALGDARRASPMRLLAEACDRVDPAPDGIDDDQVTWRTPRGAADPVAVTLAAPLDRIQGWIAAEVVLEGGGDARRRHGFDGDGPMRGIITIATRIPFGPCVREHVGPRTIPVLGAYARACAAALDGSLPAMTEGELDLALGIVVREASEAHVARSGGSGARWTLDPTGVLLRHAGETPLEPGSISLLDPKGEVPIGGAELPPFARMSVDDDGAVVVRRSTRGSFLSDPVPDEPIATLRAIARVRESMEGRRA